MTDEVPTVVLVHGLWIGRWAMAWLDHRLTQAGLRVLRFGYASMRGDLDSNAASLARYAASIDAPRIHWIGHSLGGLVIYRTIAGGHCASDGRVVMLGTPLGGSCVASRVARCQVGRALLGGSMRDWLAAPAAGWSLPNELGVIAGTRGVGLGRLIAPGLPSPNDGVVTNDEMRIPGIKEFLPLRVSHAGMLVSSRVAGHAASFIRSGSFAGEGECA